MNVHTHFTLHEDDSFSSVVVSDDDCKKGCGDAS